MYISRTDDPSISEELRKTTEYDFSYGLGLKFGIYYNISERFSIGSEINPLMLYSQYSNSNTEKNQLKINLINVSVIGLRYKF